MITINPELQSLIPPLTLEEYAQLEANVLADGCHDPLIVWQEEQTLLDGHNRYEICEQHGLPYTTMDLSLPDIASAKSWMIEQQLGRRNLTPDQMRYYRGKQYELRRQMGFKGNQHTRASGKSYQKHDTAKALADQHHVAEKTIRNDAAFAKAVDTLAEVAGPEVRQALLSRETKVSQQEVKKLAHIAATLPRKVQPVIAALKDAKTPKQAKKIVGEAARETRQYEQYMEGIAQSEGLSDGGIQQHAQAQHAQQQVEDDKLARLLNKALWSLDALHGALVALHYGYWELSLPDALARHTETFRRLGEFWRRMERALTASEAFRMALDDLPPASPKTAPQGRHPDYGKRTQAVEQMARQLHRFTCPELAKQLGDDRRAVKLVLKRKVDQKKATYDTKTKQYTWGAPAPGGSEVS